MAEHGEGRQDSVSSPDLTPLIPAWLDDYDLPTTEFRVLCHLWRRAGKKATCFPGAPSIIRICRVSDRTLWPTLAKLEALGLLRRKKVRRNSNSYELAINPARVTEERQVTQLPQNSGLQSPKNDGLQSPKDSRLQSPQNSRCKGIPMKGTNKEKSEGGAPPPALRLVQTEAERQEAKDHYRWDDATLDKAVVCFSRHKATYPTECTHDVFMVWFTQQKPGQAFLAQHKATKPTTDTQLAAAVPEPRGWSEIIKADPDLCMFSDREWGRIFEHYQKLIVAAVKKAGPLDHGRVTEEFVDAF